jgi:fructokinase
MGNKLQELNIVCFGEVLYDIFPTHKKAGGAPLNVALRLASLGFSAQIISRIGRDALGAELLGYAAMNGVDTDAIQHDDDLSTGEVIVDLNKDGSATYTISSPVAWDKIESVLANEVAVQKVDAFVFGSLACRDIISHQSLLKLTKLAPYRVFDVNLRAPFYTKDLIIQLMMQSDFVKFNDDELAEISALLSSPYHSLEQNILFVAEKTNTKHICVTKGSHGALLYYNGEMYSNDGYKVEVVDTVGAGDSFLAGLLSKLLRGEHPQEAIDFACALGAIVAKSEGANPLISNLEINMMLNKNGNN